MVSWNILTICYPWACTCRISELRENWLREPPHIESLRRWGATTSQWRCNDSWSVAGFCSTWRCSGNRPLAPNRPIFKNWPSARPGQFLEFGRELAGQLAGQFCGPIFRANFSMGRLYTKVKDSLSVGKNWPAQKKWPAKLARQIPKIGPAGRKANFPEIGRAGRPTFRKGRIRRWPILAGGWPLADGGCYGEALAMSLSIGMASLRNHAGPERNRANFFRLFSRSVLQKSGYF